MNASIRAILTTTAAATFLGSANAGETKPASDVKPQAETGKYELKKKSAFSLAADRRAPFWPIGWVKRVSEIHTSVAQAPQRKIDERAFTVTSILVGNPSLAVVNGRAYSEGEFIRMPKGSGIKVRVQLISDGVVSLGCEQQNFVVAMKRPELAMHKAEDVLESDHDEQH